MCRSASVSSSSTAGSSPRLEILRTPPVAPSSIRNVWSRSLPRSVAVPSRPKRAAAIAATSLGVKRGGGASRTLSVSTGASVRASPPLMAATVLLGLTQQRLLGQSPFGDSPCCCGALELEECGGDRRHLGRREARRGCFEDALGHERIISSAALGDSTGISPLILSRLESPLTMCARSRA